MPVSVVHSCILPRPSLAFSPSSSTPPSSPASFVASSPGRQISSRLLSMRSAHALLELPCAAGCLPASSLVPAILIADLASSLTPSTVPLPSPTAVPPAPSDAAALPPSASHSCSHHHHHHHRHRAGARTSLHPPAQQSAVAAATDTGTGTGAGAATPTVRGSGTGGEAQDATAGASAGGEAARGGSSGSGIRVAVLTVSDSVASGVAEDARWAPRSSMVARNA